MLELVNILKQKLLALSELIKKKEMENRELKQKHQIFENLKASANELNVENEKLRNQTEILKNEYNVLKTELEELKASNKLKEKEKEIKLNSTNDLEKLNKQYEFEIKNNWDTIKDLQQQLKHKDQKIEELNLNCHLTGEAEEEEEDHSVLIKTMKRELDYLKSNNIYLVNNYTSDDKSKSILDTVYSFETQENSALLSDTSKNNEVSILYKENRKLKSQFEEEKIRNNEIQDKTIELNKKLENCKTYLQEYYTELETLKKRDSIKKKLENKEIADLVLKNIEVLDSKLKSVHTFTVDLFMEMNKNKVIKMEKALNDCISEYKEIKKVILE